MNALGFIADDFNFPGFNFAFGVGYLEVDIWKDDVTSPCKLMISFFLIRPMKSLYVCLEESLSLFIGRDEKEVLFEGGETFVYFKTYSAQFIPW